LDKILEAEVLDVDVKVEFVKRYSVYLLRDFLPQIYKVVYPLPHCGPGKGGTVCGKLGYIKARRTQNKGVLV
jgi:hypothetical protein